MQGMHTDNMGHDEIAATLACEIISGARPTGSRMPTVEEMNDRFGVSRVLMREVTKTLTAKGLIVAKSKVGTLVLPPRRWHWFDPDFLAWKVRIGLDVQFFRQLTDMRRAVEPAAARLAAQHGSQSQLEEMHRSLDAMRASGTNRSEFVKADVRFHVAIGGASGNPLFLSFASVVEAALSAALSLTAPLDEEDVAATAAMHARIADAIARRDPAAASQAMLDVIDEGARRV